MIDARTVQYHVRRKINRMNSKYSGYIKPSDLDEYINESLSAWTVNNIAKAEINSETRADLRILEVKDKSLNFKPSKGKPKVVAELPSNHLRTIRRRLKASVDCGKPHLDECKGCIDRDLKIRIAQSGEIDDLLDDPYWKPSFEWRETIGDEASDGLHVWTDGNFKVNDVFIDYYRKPLEVRTPSLMKEGFYTIGNKTYNKDVGLELDQTYQVNEITDLAALFILRDLSDGQEYQAQINKILNTQQIHLT